MIFPCVVQLNLLLFSLLVTQHHTIFTKNFADVVRNTATRMGSMEVVMALTEVEALAEEGALVVLAATKCLI